MCKNHIKPFFLKPILFVLILTFSSCGLMEKDNGKTEDISPTEIFIQGVGLNVQRVAFNSDGSRLITSGNKGTTIWDMQAKKELINLYNNDAHSSAVSKSGRYLITFNPADHGLIKICDLTTFKIHSLRIFDKEESGYGRYISGITISDDEKYFALYSNKIMVFDLESLSQINHIELKSRHYLFDYRKQGLSFLPGTNDLLSISYDISFSEPDVVTEEGDLNLNQIDHYSVNIWDIKSKEPKIEIDLNCNFILSYALSPDNKKLALLLINKELRIIDIINRTVNNHRIEVERDIDAISYTNDGSILFANRKGIIGRYYSDSKKHIIINTDIRSRFRAYSCSDLAIANDGENIVFCSGYSTLLLYNVADNETTLLTDEAKNLFGAYYDSGTLVNILTSDKIFHQNGPSFNASEVKIKQLLSYVCADQLMIENIFSGEKQIFDLNLARTLFSGVIEENEEYYAITRDGKYGFKSLQQGENDNILAVYDMENTYSNPVLLEKSGGYGINIKVFNSNRKAIIAGFATDLLTIWDLQTGEIIDTLDIQSGNARAFDFIDDSKCLVGVRGIVRLYDMNSRNIIKSYIPKGYDGRYKDITKISFSPDKKYFATGDTDGLVTIWSFDNENELVSFKTHKDWITFLTFSPDGKNIISGSYSGKSLVISEVTTGKDIARFVAFADGEWIVITPKGYFNASPNGAKYLNVRVGNQVYSIDNFHEKYFNPAYVASVLQGKRIEATDDIREGVAPPPEIRFASPRPNMEFDSEEITVTVSAKDMGGGIDEIRLYHNDKAVGEETRGMKVKSAGKEQTEPAATPEITKSYTLSLVNGVNVFRAVGYSKDRTESNPVEIMVRMTGGSKNVSMYVFTVGVNNYENPALNLNYAQPDAKGIADFFRQSGKGLFKSINITDIYNDQATKAGILAGLGKLKNTQPQDAVLIFLAGHGENIEDKWYFIPYELRYPEREEDVKSKGISSDELSGHIRNIRAQKILVLIDACKSGAALVAFRGFEDRKALAQLSRATGVHVVAASNKDQFASEVKELGHGVFTYTLLEGLKGRAAAKGEAITVRKLMGYVEEELPELTMKYRQEAQFPVVDSKGMDFPLALGR